MSDDLVPLAMIGLVAFFIGVFGCLIYFDGEATHLRYEQCIAADKQWIGGGCVR
jgi:hypothetical protein